MDVKIKASDVMLLVAGLPVVAKAEDGAELQIIPQGTSLNEMIVIANKKSRGPGIDYPDGGEVLYIEEPNSEE